MAFKRPPWFGVEDPEARAAIKQQYEKEQQLKLNDILGGGGSQVINLKVEGEAVSGVITDIETDAKVYDFVSKNQKFWVDSKPTPVPAAEARAAGYSPVHQVMITVTREDGQSVRIPFNSKDERDALKVAIEAAGGEINVGDTIGKKLVKRDGNKKYHVVKLVPAS